MALRFSAGSQKVVLDAQEPRFHWRKSPLYDSSRLY